jgi:hypothetical protein
MQAHADSSQADTLPTARLGCKRLGAYLLEAGLLTEAQVQVALYDRAATGKRFSEIVVDHGWVKQKTIDFLMQKVIIPEQQATDSQLYSRRRLVPTATPAPSPPKSESSKSQSRPRHSTDSSHLDELSDLMSETEVEPPDIDPSEVTWLG